MSRLEFFGRETGRFDQRASPGLRDRPVDCPRIFGPHVGWAVEPRIKQRSAVRTAVQGRFAAGGSRSGLAQSCSFSQLLSFSFWVNAINFAKMRLPTRSAIPILPILGPQQ